MTTATYLERVRNRRMAHVWEHAPFEFSFVGYGGSSVSTETLVFNDRKRGIEVRTPVFPSQWESLDEIESEYGCLALRCTCEAFDVLTDWDDEHAEAMA